MRKILMIVRFEYARQVRRRAFLFTALGVPLLIIAIIGVIGLVVMRTGAEQRLGLVDNTGAFALIDIHKLDISRPIPLDTFPDEAAARRAFDEQRIDAYIVVPANYLQTGATRAVGRRRLSDHAQNEIQAVLEAGILARAPAANRDRLAEPMKLVLRTLEGGREVGADNGLLFLLPYVFALLFIMTTFTTSGYLLQAVAEEKEDRVIEILTTTVGPRDLMAGKIIGLSAVGLTQMLIWVGVGVIAVLSIARNTSWITDLHLPPSLPWLALLYFLLGYLLISACYATIGAAVTTPQEAQPLVTPITLIALAPLFLIYVILSQPNGTIAVVLSLIPFSAPVTMLMRLPLADIPAWQIIVSLILLFLTAGGAMALAGRVMRLGMLRYGQRLHLREMFSAHAQG